MSSLYEYETVALLAQVEHALQVPKASAPHRLHTTLTYRPQVQSPPGASLADAGPSPPGGGCSAGAPYPVSGCHTLAALYKSPLGAPTYHVPPSGLSRHPLTLPSLSRHRLTPPSLTPPSRAAFLRRPLTPPSHVALSRRLLSHTALPRRPHAVLLSPVNLTPQLPSSPLPTAIVLTPHHSATWTPGHLATRPGHILPTAHTFHMIYFECNAVFSQCSTLTHVSTTLDHVLQSWPGPRASGHSRSTNPCS
jgi:hypothetical protein